MTTKKIEFTRVNRDVNGNPRYVCHFFDLLPTAVRESQKSISELYAIALKNSRQFGGQKYRGKDYGGGIVFQSYNIDDLSDKILNFTWK